MSQAHPGRVPGRCVPLAYGGVLVYVLLALILAQERLLNSDCSYQLFRSVNDRTFFFQEARYGMFITQIPMLAGVLLGLPMKALIVLYSLGLAGTYGIIIILARELFRSEHAALAIMLSLVMGVGDSFCHSTTETHLLLALSGLLYASLLWLGSSARSIGRYAVVALITLWALFTHPNALFTIGFVTALAVTTRKVRLVEGAGVLALCALFFLIRLLLLPSDSYDGRQFEALGGSASTLPHFWKLFPIWFIEQYLVNEYAPVVVVIALLLLFLRPWRVLVLTIGSAAILWVLTVLTFHAGGGEAMMEKSFMPVIFMLCVPFAYLCFHHKGRKWFTALAALFMVHAFVNIGYHSTYYSTRLNALETVIRNHGEAYPKMILLAEEIQGTSLNFSEWATSLDALMLSRCMGDTARTVFIGSGQPELHQAIRDTDSFLYLPWQPTDTVPLNRFYFNLPTVPYHIVHEDLPPRIGRFTDT